MFILLLFFKYIYVLCKNDSSLGKRGKKSHLGRGDTGCKGWVYIITGFGNLKSFHICGLQGSRGKKMRVKRWVGSDSQKLGM